jgi:hypothetical protein
MRDKNEEGETPQLELNEFVCHTSGSSASSLIRLR